LRNGDGRVNRYCFYQTAREEIKERWGRTARYVAKLLEREGNNKKKKSYYCDATWLLMTFMDTIKEP